MNVSSINTQKVAGAALAGNTMLRSLAGEDFVPGSRAPGGQHEQLVEQAQKWVAQTFFGQMLKQMRNSPFKTDLSSGGRGAEAFGGLLDERLAERMSRGAGRKLVDSLVRRMEARAAYARGSQDVTNHSVYSR